MLKGKEPKAAHREERTAHACEHVGAERVVAEKRLFHARQAAEISMALSVCPPH